MFDFLTQKEEVSISLSFGHGPSNDAKIKANQIRPYDSNASVWCATKCANAKSISRILEIVQTSVYRLILPKNQWFGMIRRDPFVKG